MLDTLVQTAPDGSTPLERRAPATIGSPSVPGRARSGRAPFRAVAAGSHRSRPDRRRTLALASVFAALISLGAATDTRALPLGDSVRHFDRARSSFIVERRTTLAPMGHVVFCLRHAEACRSDPGGDPGPVELTPERLAVLERVNGEVNRTIRPRPDRRGPGVIDQWSLAPEAGDCEDYALTKRHRLQAEGWPAAALRLATTRTRDGEGHAVLVVRTAAGDLVLDNRTGAILPWTATDLSWIAIQSGTDPRLWHGL